MRSDEHAKLKPVASALVRRVDAPGAAPQFGRAEQLPLAQRYASCPPRNQARRALNCIRPAVPIRVIPPSGDVGDAVSTADSFEPGLQPIHLSAGPFAIDSLWPETSLLETVPPDVDANATSSKFWAFISYSQHDKRQVMRLYRALETYRLPRRLKRHAVENQPLPRRLFPVFLDREELSSSVDIGAGLKEALKSSHSLVVVCSPRSAASQWVEAEVAYFCSLGRGDRIFCAIIDGEPNAADPARECFVPSLRSMHTTPGLPLFEQRAPIAADLRDGRDGNFLGLLKLVAAIANVSLAELRQRDRRRRIWTGVRLGGLLCGAGLGLLLFNQRHERAQAELIRQERIERDVEQGRQELLAGDSLRALPLLSDAYSLGGEGDPLRFLLARAFGVVGDRTLALSDTTNPIRMAGFDQSGLRLWTFHDDGTIQAHDPAKGLAGLRLGSAEDPAGEIAISPDGKFAAFARGAKADIRDTETNRVHCELTGHKLDIKSLAYDATGSRLVSASVDDTARIWDADTGRELARLTGHSATVLCAEFSENGEAVVTGSADGSVRVWQSGDGAPIAVLRGATSTITKVGLSLDRRWVAATCRDGRAACWRISAAEPVTLSSAAKFCLAFSFHHPSAEAVFAVASEDGTLEILDARDARPVAVLSGHRGRVVSGEFTRDGTRLVSASWDHSAKVWDTVSGRLLRNLEFVKGQSPVQENLVAAGFSPAGDYLWTLNWGGVVTVWRDDRAGLIASNVPHVQRGGFSGDGSRCFVANATMLEVWDKARRERLASVTLDNALIRAIALNHDGRRLAVLTADERVIFWEMPGQRVVATLPGHAFAFSPDGGLLLVAASAGVSVIDSQSGQVVRRLEADAVVLGVRWSPDGNQIVSLAADDQVAIWDAASGTRIRSFAVAAARQPADLAAVTRDLAVTSGPFRLLTTDEETVSVWDPQKPALITRFRAHDFALLDLKFDRARRRIVTTGGDGFAKIWDLDSGRALLNLPCGSDFVYSGGFSPNGSLLLTSNSGNHITLWDAVLGRPLAGFDGVVAAFSPDGRQMLMGGHSVSLMPLDFERRDPAVVRALVERECPWRLVDDHLVAVALHR